MVERKMRFGESAWRLIQEEAERQGMTATAYVREAAVARALVDRTQNDPAFAAKYARIIEQLRSPSD